MATISIIIIKNKIIAELLDSKTYFSINPTPISCIKVLMLAIIKSLSRFNSFHLDKPMEINTSEAPISKST